MFPLYEISTESHDLNNRARKALSDLEELLPLTPSKFNLSKGDNICDAGGSPKDYLFIVKEGFLKYSLGSKLLLFLESGDLIGFNEYHTGADVNIHSELATKLNRYPRSEFLRAVSSTDDMLKLWNRYLRNSLSLMTSFISRLTPSELNIELDTNFFWPGDAIIIQETAPKQVYTLLNGTAEVYLGESRVGEVLPGEIFGAMAATADSRTSASVIAKTPCLVMSLPKENFLILAKTHPETLFKLIEDMSRIILSQNEKIVELESAVVC